VPLNRIGAFESALLNFVAANRGALLETLNGGNWNDELEAELKSAIEDFKSTGSW
jgi:F-type H+-transporting ATPase subunit alpha